MTKKTRNYGETNRHSELQTNCSMIIKSTVKIRYIYYRYLNHETLHTYINIHIVIHVFCSLTDKATDKIL